MSYLTLTLGGKKRGIKFGNRALLDIMNKQKATAEKKAKETGKKYNPATTGQLEFSFDLVVDLVYFGLLNNALIKKETPDFNENDVTEWVDDMPPENLTTIFAAFQESYTAKDETVSASSKKE